MSNPVRLAKKENLSFNDRLDNFAKQYAQFIVMALIMILFFLIAFLFIKMCGICAVESGMLRNFLNGGV